MVFHIEGVDHLVTLAHHLTLNQEVHRMGFLTMALVHLPTKPQEVHMMGFLGLMTTMLLLMMMIIAQCLTILLSEECYFQRLLIKKEGWVLHIQEEEGEGSRVTFTCNGCEKSKHYLPVMAWRERV